MAKKRTDRERSPFGARMALAREASGLKQVQVCKALQISQGTLSELEGVAASSGRVVEFSRLYEVNPDWLATGVGEMRAPLANESPPTDSPTEEDYMPSPFPGFFTDDEWHSLTPDERGAMGWAARQELERIRMLRAGAQAPFGKRKAGNGV